MFAGNVALFRFCFFTWFVPLQLWWFRYISMRRVILDSIRDFNILARFKSSLQKMMYYTFCPHVYTKCGHIKVSTNPASTILRTNVVITFAHCLRRWPNIKPALVDCTVFSGKHPEGGSHLIPANTRRWPNAGLMLAHRLRRWTNINRALGQRFVFPGMYLNISMTSVWGRLD